MISKKNILKLQTKRDIYQFILKNPGLYFREISRKMNIPRSTLEHHLKHLEKYSLIATKIQGTYTRYYVTNKINTKEKGILGIIRQETSKDISLLLLCYITCSQTFISKELNKHPTTISFHFDKLMKAGIVERAPYNNGAIHRKKEKHIMKINKAVKHEIFYRLRNPEIIYNLFITHKNSLLKGNKYKSILYFLENPTQANIRSSCKQLNIIDSAIDEVEKKVFEIFPHPYHI